MIQPAVEKVLFPHIRMKCVEMGCALMAIDGSVDHIHVLVELNANVCVADFFKTIKGSSSRAINQSGICKKRFQWQTGYAAFSVSRDVVPIVAKYIQRQKQHHAPKPTRKR